MKSNAMVSIETIDLLAKFCRVPVRKACGKKKPLIQNTGGMPSVIQVCRNWILCSRSITQEAKGFSDG